MRFGITLFLFVAITFNLFGTSDTLNVRDVRSFDSSKLEQYRADSDFNYSTGSAQVSWWIGFREWLADLLQDYFQDKDEEAIGQIVYIIIRVLLWALALTAIGLVLYSLYKKGVFGLIGRKRHQLTMSDDDLLLIKEEIEWEKLIRQSIQNQKYNEAIRYLFLQVLKILSDLGKIELNKAKSIRDYQRELSIEYSDQFALLARCYQYVWFGGVTIDKKHFEDLHATFRDFNETVNVE
ncbi:MAG: hypothetical protein RLO81_07465 [Fulvivirga sp.]|uniref:hypothetical protein n=1 Tax=Fulvivirga sp. TaxID=1931237 RepID=UPI0032EAD403